MVFEIGCVGWTDVVRSLTAPLGSAFWSSFRPASASDIQRIESSIDRKLPGDFIEFYRTIGYGSFSKGGKIYSPDEILASLGAPIYFVLGSLTPGKEWCSEEAHRRLWLSRGIENPEPSRFTGQALTLNRVSLLDLLQVGSNGCSCYHQIHVGPEPRRIGYCLLTESQTLEDEAPNFSRGLVKLISFYLMDSDKEE